MADEFDGIEPTADGALLVRIERYLSGAASEAEVAQLNQDLAASPENRDLFIRMASLSGLMVEHFTLSRAHADVEASLREVSEAASPPARIGDQKSRSPVLRFLGRIPVALTRPVLWSIAAVALLFYSGFVILSWNLRPDKLPNFAAGSSDSVAVVRDTKDVQWSTNGASKSAESSILPGESLKINSGFVQLELKSGATLLVEGPAQWSIDDDNRAMLESGKIFAKVPSQAVGFTIQTSAATVIDLGTEFGLEVTPDQQSRLHVFKGKVVVRANRSETSATAEPREIELREGESISVGAQGAFIGHSRSEAQTAHSFVRKVPKKIIKVLNLVDVVAGGDGFGRARDRGIDPTTGKTTATQVKSDGPMLMGDGNYHRVEELPFVDGVFIPRGKNPVQLDSAGHTFAGFPSIDNRTWGLIWAGGVIPQHSVQGVNQGALSASLGGVDYSANWHSLLSVHANKGITFDLEALRRANPDRKILRFVAVAGNAAPARTDASQWCDVWVFVDGQPRFTRERIKSQQEIKIAVELEDQNRFLSLVATDGGDTFDWDHVIFVDPCLVMSQTVAEEPAERDSDGRRGVQEINSVGEKGGPRGVEKAVK